MKKRLFFLEYIFPNCWILFFCFLLTSFGYLFASIDFIDSIHTSVDKVYAGMLAIAGFILTARTFITFKLNELIYGNPNYQKLVESRQHDGAYNKSLYDPLKRLDKKLASASSMSIICVLIITFGIYFPKVETILIAYKVISCISFSYLTVTLIFFIHSVIVMSENIQAIIDYWESTYNDEKKKRNEEKQGVR